MHPTSNYTSHQTEILYLALLVLATSVPLFYTTVKTAELTEQAVRLSSGSREPVEILPLWALAEVEPLGWVSPPPTSQLGDQETQGQGMPACLLEGKAALTTHSSDSFHLTGNGFYHHTGAFQAPGNSQACCHTK